MSDQPQLRTSRLVLRAFRRVQARHLTRNPATGRGMQKAGMTLEGIHRGSMRKWDRVEDLAMYAILATDARPGG